MKPLDDVWRGWIERNLAEGCSKDILFKLLHDSGFRYETIREALDHEPTVSLDRIFRPLASLGEARQPTQQESLAALLAPRPLPAPSDEVVEGLIAQQRRVPFLGCGGKTPGGFEVQRMDEEVFAEVRLRFERAKTELEVEGSEGVDHYLRSVNRYLPPALIAIDADFNRTLLELMKPLHEAWCGFELECVTCYGFRVYLGGAYLYDHVDRQDSHVISSSLCVESECYLPWPMHVEGADGVWHDVETQPGELFLYESARIAHGRPTPLNGNHYAALFLHYRPAEDWELWRESPQAWFERYRS